MKITNFLRLATIISALPNNIQNGQTADAVPLMADLNHIVNQVNANAVEAGTVALLAAANTFTEVQSGVAATNAANFPIASQVQNRALNTLTSTLGTNTITARVAAMAPSAYAAHQIFTFIPTQPNTGAVTLDVNGLGAKSVVKTGSLGSFVSLGSSDILAGAMAIVGYDASGNGQFVLTNPAPRSPVIFGPLTLSSVATDFIGIPPWAKHLVVSLDSASYTNGQIEVQIGDSGGNEPTGYTFIISSIGGGGAAATTGFRFHRGGAPGDLFFGSMDVTLENPGTNLWGAKVVSSNPVGTPVNYFGAGSKALSSRLDRVRIASNGSTFTGGTASLLCM